MKILGVCTIKVDGALYKTVADSVELMIGGRARKSVVGDETVNYQDGPLVPSKLTCEFLHTNKSDLKKLNDFVEGMLEIETDIGVTYTMPNASRTGDPVSTSSSSGRIKFQAEGDPVPGL